MSCMVMRHPNLQPGWGCCGCRTYNGGHRARCKHCGHAPCDIPDAELQALAAESAALVGFGGRPGSDDNN